MKDALDAIKKLETAGFSKPKLDYLKEWVLAYAEKNKEVPSVNQLIGYVDTSDRFINKSIVKEILFDLPKPKEKTFEEVVLEKAGKFSESEADKEKDEDKLDATE